MALNPTGPMSMGGPTSGTSINLELGRSATATIDLNDAQVRSLAQVPSGAISISNFYGKSSGPPPGPPSVTYAVVGGGGGGGGRALGGGGGAGAVTLGDSSVSNLTTYCIRVGAGGAINAIGTDSCFGSIACARGGGRGGSLTAPGNGQGQFGGSGGGGGGYQAVNFGGTCGPGLMNNGGNSSQSYGNPGGGGGGAGSAGTDGQANPGSGTTYAGFGGQGVTDVIFQLACVGVDNGSGQNYLGAGGGGKGGPGEPGITRANGDGGLGGGGQGQFGDGDPVCTTGRCNTGSGGGGSYQNWQASNAAGGSGVVVIAYPADAGGNATCVTGSPCLRSVNGCTVYVFRGSGSIRWG